MFKKHVYSYTVTAEYTIIQAVLVILSICQEVKLDFK